MAELSNNTAHVEDRSINLTLVKKKKIAKNTFEVSFRIGKKKFPFIPGQYLHITLPSLIEHDPRGNARDFSIASSPNDKYLSIATRTSDSPFKKTLLMENLKAEIAGPFGVFTLPQDTSQTIIFIAGGIGITPFLSMLKFSTEEKIPRKIVLLYLNKDRESAAYINELEKLEKLNPNFTLRLLFTRLTPDNIIQEIEDVHNSLFFLSGPPGMIENTRSILANMSISQQMISIEEFSGLKEETYTSEITDNRSAEYKLLQRSLPDLEALLQALSNSAIVSETNAQGNITFANDMFVEISKYSREELIGQNHRILKSGLHSKALYENLWATISRGRIWRGLFKNKAKDGTYYWVDSSIAPILGKDGKPFKYISVRFLVTERQQAEEALRETIKQQNALAILSQEALANTNLLLLFDTATKLLKKTLNIDYAAVLKLLPGSKNLLYEAGTGLDFAVKGKTIVSAEENNSMAAYTLASKQPTIVKDITTESRFVGATILHDHNVRSGVCVAIQGSENPYGILQVYSTKKRDFTIGEISLIQSFANLLANAARNQLDKRKDEFLGVASHEIKTPLTSIKTFTQLLYKHAEKQKDEHSLLFLSKMDHQINKMTDLISDLLDISRINSGKIVYNDELFNINEIADEIISELQLTTKKHKIILEKNISRKIYGDKFRIGQVLTNLLTNAIKFSPGSDKIEVSTQEDDERVVVSVQDYGIGIPKNEQPHIFGRFYQGNGIRGKLFPGGLGLGLYISAEIIKRHNGEMWVESEEGKGSKFSFSLPHKK